MRRNKTSWWQRGLVAIAAGYLVLAQLAVTSVELHAWLHGQSMQDPAGQHCPCPHEDTPHSDSHENHASGHLCLVNLLAAGISGIDFPVFELPQVEPALQELEWVSADVPAGQTRQPPARAPPVKIWI